MIMKLRYWILDIKKTNEMKFSFEQQPIRGRDETVPRLYNPAQNPQNKNPSKLEGFCPRGDDL